MKEYFVYMVKCSNESFYIGITNNLERRIEEHNFGLDKKAYTYSRRPLKLVWAQEFDNPNEAILKEKQLKGWSRRKKIALIDEDWEKLVEYSKNSSNNQ